MAQTTGELELLIGSVILSQFKDFNFSMTIIRIKIIIVRKFFKIHSVLGYKKFKSKSLSQ